MQHQELRLSFTARAECMHDITVLLKDVLGDEAITRYTHGYSARNTEVFEGHMELVFQAPVDHRVQLRKAIVKTLVCVANRAKNDDLHVLRDTLNFTTDFSGERMDDRLQERIIDRLTDKLDAALVDVAVP